MRAVNAFALLLCVLCLGLAVETVGAQPAREEGWPTRVGRVADLQGTLWAYDVDEGAWVSAWRNRPVAEGDLFAVSDDGRAELRIGTTVLRLDGGSELEVLALDDAHMVFELHRGALAWRVRSEAHARQAELRLQEGSVRPLGPGHFRIDRGPGEAGPAHAAAWRGRLEIAGGGNLIHLDPGERVQMRADGGRGVVTTRPARMPDDALSDWALAADAREATVEAYRHVPPDLTGVEDLDRHGRWDRHPEHGSVWLPYAVPAGWEPFREGRWVWLRPWGWTWADAAPWGFAPFHYGRWVRWSGRWAWWPGPRGAVPVFQPALVAWVGGPDLSFAITIGAGVRPPPPVAWVPLAPYQPYVPRYRPPPWVGGPPSHVIPRPPRQARPPRYVEPVPPPRQRRALPPLEVHRGLAPDEARRGSPAGEIRRVQPPGDAGTPRATVPPTIGRPPRGDAVRDRSPDAGRDDGPSRAGPPGRDGSPMAGPGRGLPSRDGPVRGVPPRDSPGRDGAPGAGGPARGALPPGPAAPPAARVAPGPAARATPAAPADPPGSAAPAGPADRARGLPPSPRVAPSLPARPGPTDAAPDRAERPRGAERER